MRRQAPLLTFLATVGAAAAPAAAGAAKPLPPKLVITPAHPKADQPITVSFRADGRLPRDRRYRVEIWAGAPNSRCIRLGDAVLLRERPPRGRIVRAQVFPYRQGATVNRWCAGRAEAQLRTVDVDGRVSPAPIRRSFTIAKDAHYPADADIGTDLDITVLDGSAITVTAPGRPDRTLPLGGSITGLIPGKFVLNSTWHAQLRGGSLAMRSLVTDPLCAGTAYHLVSPLGSGSTATFETDGRVSAALVLAADPVSLAGCAGAATGATTLQLSGALGERKLADLTLAGSLAGVPIATGVAATMTVTLRLSVAIRD